MSANPGPPSQTPTEDGPLYDSPVAALREVRESYTYWSSQLTSSSFQLCIALIAANWAAFGSAAALRGNSWASASLIVVLVCLGLSLLGTARMANVLYESVGSAEKDRDSWAREFIATAKKDDPWPYSREAITLAQNLRWVKTWMPVAGGILLVIALVTSSLPTAAKS